VLLEGLRIMLLAASTGWGIFGNAVANPTPLSLPDQVTGGTFCHGQTAED
jgi:hypothetical protein